MSQLMITEEQQRFLDESREPVEIVDRSGRLLTKLKVSHGFSDAELDEAVRAARNFVHSGTLRELLDRYKATSVSVLVVYIAMLA